MSENTHNRDRSHSKTSSFKDVEKEYKEELLAIDRVTRVTAGWRQLRFRASVVIGNGKGSVGLWTGKAWEVVVAIDKAIRDAKKNLISFPIVKGTIPHQITCKFKALKMMFHPASEGTGIIAWGSVRKMLFVSWVKDILAKRYGSSNSITSVRLALKALQLLKSPSAVKFLKADAPGATTPEPSPVVNTEASVEAPETSSTPGE